LALGSEKTVAFIHLFYSGLQERDSRLDFCNDGLDEKGASADTSKGKNLGIDNGQS
jgi:hypothetical protein